MGALLEQTNDTESEEHHKNLVIEFLKGTWYGKDYYVNTKERTDLVIHTDKKSKSPVGVIVETKKPTNAAEMITADDLNRKAFHELILYYLRERITQKNLEIKHVIATNIYEWFIFDANTFEKLFAKDRKFVRKFEQFEAGKLSGTDTSFFYNEIAKPFVADLQKEIPYTYVDLKTYGKLIDSEADNDQRKLINLYKLFSPEHLLKLPFANDSNSLDKRFYAELLHIIGLTEVKEGSKKLIQRKPAGERDSGSLMENAITQLESLDKLSRLPKPSLYGANREERLFNVALELVITWVNRILFLKLLEAQLQSYHDGNNAYVFLNKDKLTDFDDLNSLFFQVLARKHEDRLYEVGESFKKVPYLNSSLFDPTELEHNCLFISNLRNHKEIPIISTTVLKKENGKKRKGDVDTLAYLFDFLDAYDFSSEAKEQIQEENKTLINASVLGLIFEKINGYKDGSFFTPGFITMYMCRETIRRSVVQKFNEANDLDLKEYNQLYDHITDKQQANDLINSIKICDPAVGSGHFLVSALNEILAVKSDLKILQDRNGRTLRDYTVEVVNDELVITDDNGDLFEYHPSSKESQRVQEALFHEKQTIIENCLFGVDINANSVKICRLRLWIELLKSAYYRPSQAHPNPSTGEAQKSPSHGGVGVGNESRRLETLPNIDINIKCGNSLISRFDLDADLKDALKKSKWNVSPYRNAVQSYREAKSKEEKREFQKLIADIKGDFETEISQNDPKVKILNKRSGQLYNLLNQQDIFESTKKEKKERKQQQEKLEKEIEKLTAEIEEIKSNKIYENAFEWRFEFPEVLDDDGAFLGFDCVIGNPPYVRQEVFSDLKPNFKENYDTYSGTADLYVYFIERGMRVLRNEGHFYYIVPNKWMRANYGKALRTWLQERKLEAITDFGDLPVFEEATTYPCLLQIKKEQNPGIFRALEIEALPIEDIIQKENNRGFDVDATKLQDDGWSLVPLKTQRLLEKLKAKGTPLGEYVDGKIYRGVLTGYNKAFVIDEETKNRLIAEDESSSEIIKPFLAGRDIKRYQVPQPENFLIFTRRGIEIDAYPAVKKYLEEYREQLEPRPKDVPSSKWKGRKPGSYKWYEIQDAVDYYEEFEKPKIIYPNICKQPEHTLDLDNSYTNQKCFIIGLDDKFLLGYLNSSVVHFMYEKLLPKLRGDFYEPSYVYLKEFPVPEIDERIETKTKEILNKKKTDPDTKTSDLETDIDQMVYKLFGLNEEEIAIVEGNV